MKPAQTLIPPPLPLSKRTAALAHQDDQPPFQVHEQPDGDVEFTFPKPATPSDGVSLRVIIAQYLGHPQAARVSDTDMLNILGRLRCLRHALDEYNKGVASQSTAFLTYWRKHTLNLLSGFGYRAHGDSAAGNITILGLDELVGRVEAIYDESITQARELIESGLITFDALAELFRPDTYVQAPVLSGAARCAYRVTDAYYDEHRTLFGAQRRFRVSLEAVVLVGAHFSLVQFSEVFSSWSGAKARSIAEFPYQPASASDLDKLRDIAVRAVEFGLGEPSYLAYGAGSFYMHAQQQSSGASMMSRSAFSSQALKGGRIMVDMQRGAELGQYPCQGVDEVTLAIMELSKRYRQWLASSSRLSTAVADTDLLYLWDEAPPAHLLVTCWPALVGFSFTAKSWGHVLLSGISRIEFQDKAFERLVLSAERKHLIQAVVRHSVNHTDGASQDLISGKQGGLILLLHGPPGVGKTLTAEAVAEVLRTPLYYVTMGELGVTPADLERRLTDVLDLCSGWGAVVVLDEADVFLETRGGTDIVRNAMVCVMLRILEYYSGILFLTTNRVRALDPAFESRISLALQYQPLDADARLQVWRTQLQSLSSSNVQVEEDMDLKGLAKQQLNGRQIKNTVRLACSVAMDQDVPLSEALLRSIIDVTALGRRNMVQDESWDQAVKAGAE